MTDEIDNTEDKQEDAQVQTETIDDLFEDRPETEAKDEVTEESKGEEDETKSDEAATEAKEEEESKAETPAAKEESVPLKALTEERRKRQEAEKRAQELEEQYKQQSPEVKVPDPVDDPEGYKQYMEDKSNLDALRVKVSLSRDIMIDAKTDYEEKEKVFVELANANPYLVQQMNASPNPAKFAYQTAVDHLEVQTYRDPKYREKLEAEIRAKVEKELQAKQPEDSGKKSALDVPDLSKATAAGKNTDKGEKLLESVYELEMPIDKA